MKRQWECDGCARVIEVDDPRSPDLPLCGCSKHWGWMEVGGQAWIEFHDEGKHPMADLAESIRRKMS